MVFHLANLTGNVQVHRNQVKPCSIVARPQTQTPRAPTRIHVFFGEKEAESTTGEALIELTTPKMFSETVDHGQGLVFVDYYAEWCGPCKLVEPIYMRSANKIKQAKFTRVNCSNFEKPYLSSLNVKLLPTFQVYKDGEFVAEFVGGKPNELASWLERMGKKA